MKSSMPCLILALALLLPCAADADELVVVVNAASGVGKISRDQVIDIFLGRFRVFPSGLRAEPIDQPDSGPLKRQFYRLLVGKDVAEINAYWARSVFSGQTSPPKQTKSNADVLSLLVSRPGGIAYIDRALVDQRLTIVFDLNYDR